VQAVSRDEAEPIVAEHAVDDECTFRQAYSCVT